MKCNNCGFNNDDKAKACIKCNVALTNDQQAFAPHTNNVSGTLYDSQTSPSDGKNGGFSEISSNVPIGAFSKTLMGEQARESYIDRPQFNNSDRENTSSSKKDCPNCGYQLMPNARFCPNCNVDVLAIKPVSTPNAKISPNYKGTIDPYSQKSFILRPIVNGEASKTGLEFTGGSTVLNRENTVKENMTITSKEQAEIILENGEWFIKDKSEKQTTFIRPGEPIKINKGDIILLGDTKFIFE